MYRLMPIHTYTYMYVEPRVSCGPEGLETTMLCSIEAPPDSLPAAFLLMTASRLEYYSITTFIFNNLHKSQNHYFEQKTKQNSLMLHKALT